jgi:hypothetical protein
VASSIERLQDSQDSVWTFEDVEPPAKSSSWMLKAWQRWAGQRRSARPATGKGDVEGPEAEAPPEPGRGKALRQAHVALRERMRVQRGLRQVLPHLYFVERSLSRQGSLALMEVPVWVLQRALQQLSRLPADSLTEREQFSLLQQRLVEAIASRSRQSAQPQPQRRVDSPDSFMGGIDSQFDGRSAFQTGHGGLEISEVPHSVYDDLLQGTLPSRDEAANHDTPGGDDNPWTGWRRG